MTPVCDLVAPKNPPLWKKDVALALYSLLKALAVKVHVLPCGFEQLTAAEDMAWTCL